MVYTHVICTLSVFYLFFVLFSENEECAALAIFHGDNNYYSDHHTLFGTRLLHCPRGVITIKGRPRVNHQRSAAGNESFELRDDIIVFMFVI